jgi:hypothetical protein
MLRLIVVASATIGSMANEAALTLAPAALQPFGTWTDASGFPDTYFNSQFEANGGMIARFCPACDADHKTIVYSRTSALPSGKDWYKLFMSDWTSVDNALGTDFELYSSLANATAGHGAWKFCDYDEAGIGFPRGCGKSGSSVFQWNTIDPSHASLSKLVTWKMPSALGAKNVREAAVAAEQAEAAAAAAAAADYVGCYKDDHDRDFHGKFIDDVDSIATCKQGCAGFKYYALQDGRQCFCDDTFSTPYKTYSKLDDLDCNNSPNRVGFGSDARAAVAGVGWGGSYANAVYIRIGTLPPTPAPTPFPTPMPTPAPSPSPFYHAVGANCPEGQEIVTEAACRAAATASGTFFNTTVTERSRPKGCFWHHGAAYLNNDLSGTPSDTRGATNSGSMGGICFVASVAVAPAGAYVKLATGVNACPAGREITTEADCRKAVWAVMGWGGDMSGDGKENAAPYVGSTPLMPVRCSVAPVTKNMHFNTAATGAASSKLAPVCKAAPTTTTLGVPSATHYAPAGKPPTCTVDANGHTHVYFTPGVHPAFKCSHVTAGLTTTCRCQNLPESIKGCKQLVTTSTKQGHVVHLGGDCA